jgi:hypothetical protein
MDYRNATEGRSLDGPPNRDDGLTADHKLFLELGRFTPINRHLLDLANELKPAVPGMIHLLIFVREPAFCGRVHLREPRFAVD